MASCPCQGNPLCGCRCHDDGGTVHDVVPRKPIPIKAERVRAADLKPGDLFSLHYSPEYWEGRASPLYLSVGERAYIAAFPCFVRSGGPTPPGDEDAMVTRLTVETQP